MRPSRIESRSVVMVLALGILIALAIAEEAPPEEAQTVSLQFDGQPFSKVLRTLEPICGIKIELGLDIVKRGDIGAVPIHLRMRDVQIRAALDWLVRLLDASYVEMPDGSILITNETDWIAAQKVERRTYEIAGLFEDDDCADLEQLLESSLRLVTRVHEDAKLTFSARRNRLVAVQPPAGHERIAEVLAALKGEPKNREPLAGVWERREIDRRLGLEITADLTGKTLIEALGEIGRQSGLNFGCASPGALRTIEADADFEEVPARRVVEALIEEVGMGMRIVEPGRGVWISTSIKERPPSSGLAPWQRVNVVAFETADLVELLESGPLLAGVIRDGVDRGDWRDEISVCSYSPATGRLLVVADRRVTRDVKTYIDILRQAGPDVLKVQRVRRVRRIMEELEKVRTVEEAAEAGDGSVED